MNPIDYQRMVEQLRGLSDDAFVMKAYLALLGRAPDASGAAGYASRLRAGVPRLQVWTEVAQGQEARDFANRQATVGRPAAGPLSQAHSVSDLLGYDGVDFVRAAYLAVLGREADPGGLRDYASRLAAGTPKQQLLADMRCDPEGQVYAAALSGLDDLVQQLQAGSQTGGLPMSLDDLLALHGEPFVRAAYQILFKRDPDPQGLARYVEILWAGFSTLHVVKALSESPEAREKAVNIPGLKAALSSYNKAQLKNWTGWYHRAAVGTPSELPSERQLRAMAYRLLEAKK